MWFCVAQWYVDEPGWNLVAKYLKNSVIFGRWQNNDGQTRLPLGGFWQGVLDVNVLYVCTYDIVTTRGQSF